MRMRMRIFVRAVELSISILKAEAKEEARLLKKGQVYVRDPAIKAMYKKIRATGAPMICMEVDVLDNVNILDYVAAKGLADERRKERQAGDE